MKSIFLTKSLLKNEQLGLILVDPLKGILTAENLGMSRKRDVSGRKDLARGTSGLERN